MPSQFVGLADHVREDNLNGQSLNDDKFSKSKHKVRCETRLESDSVEAYSGCHLMAGVQG
jgi:hypothetical protein